MESAISRNQNKKRVNFSITEECYTLLKKQARENHATMSKMIEDWIRNEEELSSRVRISRRWVKDLDIETLERLEDFCYENHTSPSEAVTRWIWGAKVKNTSIRGQMSFLK